jgi:hypothetical protein
MAGFLDAALTEQPRSTATLTELERMAVKDGSDERVLVVAERADGARVLAREVERADKSDGAAKGATVKVLKPTPMLRDFALAIDAGLL